MQQHQLEQATILAATTNLSKTHVDNLRDIFALLDEGKKGYINTRDLPVALNLAELETTPEERVGLIAVHVADKETGVTELELLTIADVIASTRKDSFAFSTEEQLRRAFDALASNEHGVVPVEGVLQWGEDVMKACDECLLLEHGFDYNDPRRVAALMDVENQLNNKKKKKNNKKGASGKNNKNTSRKMKHLTLEGVPNAFDNSDDEDDDDFGNDDDDDDDDDDNEIDFSMNNNINTRGASRNLNFENIEQPKGLQRRKSQTEEFITKELEKKRQKEMTEREEMMRNAGGGDTNPAAATRLRRRSSSAVLVPNQRFNYNDDGGASPSSSPENDTRNHHAGDDASSSQITSFTSTTGSPSNPKSYKLPEVAVQQKITGNTYSSFSARTVGGSKLLSHHEDAATIFGHDDVEQTTDWLLNLLGSRYKNASEGEKREIEMLLELARAAGHHVESVSGILTKDAFVKFIAQNREGGDRVVVGGGGAGGDATNNDDNQSRSEGSASQTPPRVDTGRR